MRRCLPGMLFFIFAISRLTAQPIVLHPENPHYFQFKQKPKVLITSAEHYGAVLNLDFDFRKYLHELEKSEMNMTRVFSGVYCEPLGAFNIARNSLAPTPGKFIAPWARSSTPGYRNEGNKFDLDKWDDAYFRRLRDFMTEASRRNVVVEFTLFCPFYEDTIWIYSPLHPGNNVNSTPDIPRTDVYTLDKSGKLYEIQRQLVKKLVKELNGFDNLIIEICNEPYFGGVMMNWQHAIADLIAETEKNLPKKHLVSQNIANGSSVIENPHPQVSVFNFHYAYPPTAIQLNYHLGKVIGDNETGFRGTSDSTYRFEAWRFIIAGGGLFNHLDYSFVSGHEDGSFKYPSTQPGGGGDSIRQQLRYLQRFISKFNFIKMRPDATVLDSAALQGTRYNVLAEKGKQYAVYMINNNTKSITLTVPSGKYKASWFHPKTGRVENVKTVSSIDERLLLNVPSHKEDIALRIVATK